MDYLPVSICVYHTLPVSFKPSGHSFHYLPSPFLTPKSYIADFDFSNVSSLSRKCYYPHLHTEALSWLCSLIINSFAKLRFNLSLIFLSPEFSLAVIYTIQHCSLLKKFLTFFFFFKSINFPRGQTLGDDFCSIQGFPPLFLGCVLK